MGAQVFRSSYGYVLGSIFCIVQEWKSQFDGEDIKGIDECIDIVLREIERLKQQLRNGLSRDQVISEERLDAVSMKLMVAFMASV